MSIAGREELLLDYVTGTLPDRDRAELEAHLRACDECRAMIAELRRAIAAAGTLTRDAPDVDFPELELLAEPLRGDAVATDRASAAGHRARGQHTRFARRQPALRAAAIVLVGLGVAFAAALLLRDPARSPTASIDAPRASTTTQSVPMRVRALDASGMDASTRRRALAAALRQDPSPALRAIAAQELAEFADDTTQDVLLGALRAEPSPVVQAWLLVALAQVGDTATLRAVDEWGGQPDVAPEVAEVLRTLSGV